jgi:hypothetical protein
VTKRAYQKPTFQNVAQLSTITAAEAPVSGVDLMDPAKN